MSKELKDIINDVIRGKYPTSNPQNMYSLNRLLDFYDDIEALENLTERDWKNFLFLAVRVQNHAALQTITTYIDHVNYQNQDGDTALHLAARLEDERTIKILSDAGGDLTIKNKAGETAQNIIEKNVPHEEEESDMPTSIIFWQ